MKVNSVLWLYIVSVVFMCIFEFVSPAAPSARRPTTTASKRKSNATNQTQVNSRRSRKQPTTEITGSRNISSSRTGISRSQSSPPPPEVTTEANRKGIRQLDIPKNRKKNTNPKKYTLDRDIEFVENITGPTKVDLRKPTLQNGKRSAKSPRDQLICPQENAVKFDLFPIKCDRDKDCKSWNTNEICCDIFGVKSCVAGLPKPLEETSHNPIFGIIPQRCPQRPLAELWWEVKLCQTDSDCWPGVCCPDGRKRYCRTSQPELKILPVPVKRSLNYLSEYLECTPAPPPIFDLHPKTCNSTFDCFPNVCCQEAGKKHCRPPKKSVLTFMANFLNLGLVKRLTQNLVIK